MYIMLVGSAFTLIQEQQHASVSITPLTGPFVANAVIINKSVPISGS